LIAFTIVIPTYNRRDLLQRTLATVLAQEIPVQIIVVDDGSTDGTLETLKALAGKVKVLTQPNLGPGAARNRGIEAAEGEYIAFLDSDDLFFPWTLAIYQQAIEQNDRPSFVAGKPIVFRDETELKSIQSAPLRCEKFADYYSAGDKWRWFSASSFVMRTDALRAAGGFTSEPINGEDIDLVMRIGASPGFVQVQTPPTFAYREHGENIRHDWSKTFAGLRYLIDRELTGAYPGGKTRQSERRRILTLHTRSLSLQMLHAGAKSEARTIYHQTFGWNLRQMRLRYLLAFPFMAANATQRHRGTEINAERRSDK
jgi:glycosyltransferase involved in cell wall biosynthesis